MKRKPLIALFVVVIGVALSDIDHPDRKLALLLERRGVFFWKLAGVDLPDPK